MLLSKGFVKCIKKYYSKYTNMNVAKFEIFSCCSSYKELRLQTISSFNKVSGESFNILLINTYVNFEQLCTMFIIIIIIINRSLTILNKSENATS